jgi:DNA-binding NtrC family response regulator
MSASDARTALSVLTSEPVDILLTDLELPDMSGATLAEYAISRFPSLAVIFSTGHAAAPSGPANVAARTLVKPFSFEELVSTITSVADEESRSTR